MAAGLCWRAMWNGRCALLAPAAEQELAAFDSAAFAARQARRAAGEGAGDDDEAPRSAGGKAAQAGGKGPPKPRNRPRKTAPPKPATDDSEQGDDSEGAWLVRPTGIAAMRFCIPRACHERCRRAAHSHAPPIWGRRTRAISR